MAHPRAGQPALPEDLIDVDAVIGAYYDLVPDPTNPDQQVVFGTSGHRGSSLDTAFNDAHIAATTQAIVEYRAGQGITGPLYLGKDTHALSLPGLDHRDRGAGRQRRRPSRRERRRLHPDPGGVPGDRGAQRRRHRLGQRTADGIVVTPSHNPPRDGGFKYNPPHGGPADTDATSVIAARANELLADRVGDPADPVRAGQLGDVNRFDYLGRYCEDLVNALDLDAIRDAGVHIGADPLGGASVALLGLHRRAPRARPHGDQPEGRPAVGLHDPGHRRQDPDGLLLAQRDGQPDRNKDAYDISTGNDADSDRHGIVTPDVGLMNPNAYLAVAIQYLYAHRPGWNPNAGDRQDAGLLVDDRPGRRRPRPDAGRGARSGSSGSSPGLRSGDIGFGGEESAGASFLALDGSTWTTDKDGILLALLASEIKAVTGKSPSEHYAELTAEHGAPAYARVDAPANREQKAKLAKLDPSAVTATELAGEPITADPDQGARATTRPIGGLKVSTESAWFAARPSGTEDVYKIYAESFRGPEHLAQVQEEARAVVSATLGS